MIHLRRSAQADKPTVAAAAVVEIEHPPRIGTQVILVQRPIVIARLPDAGDIVWITFSPQAGHEQAGRRPAVVLSPAAYNAKTSLMVCCPMTTQIKNYPFEVTIAGAKPSVVLSDQVKSFDWRQRRASKKGKISAEELAEIRAKLQALIG